MKKKDYARLAINFVWLRNDVITTSGVEEDFFSSELWEE